ncbi:MAG: hypothetical protein QFF03_01835 [Pseudomonadota bacterium]|nr:hypothetical protein [Pseudomonadota bacterium]
MPAATRNWLALAALAGAFGCAHATEDTDTPGDGRWEINLGVSAQRTSTRWEYAAPDTDFNYGLGERVQLVLAIPHMLLREPGVDAVSGLGSATVALKWRMIDQEAAGVALALFPAYSWNLSRSAARRGLVEPGSSLLLPLVAGVRYGATGLFAEAGRNFMQQGPHEWLAGVKATRQCLPTLECRIELQHSVAERQGGRTLASLGFKWSVAQDLIVQASAGRDFGPSGDDRRQLALKFGIQLLR